MKFSLSLLLSLSLSLTLPLYFTLVLPCPVPSPMLPQETTRQDSPRSLVLVKTKFAMMYSSLVTCICDVLFNIRIPVIGCVWGTTSSRIPVIGGIESRGYNLAVVESIM